MYNKEWIEHGQRFRLEGSVIRSLKPAKIKLAYGDERLREIREERAALATVGRSRVARLFSRLRLGAGDLDH